MTPTLTTITVAIVVTVSYIAACAYFPFGNCRRCHGTGKARSISRKFWRPCRHCDGTGRRVRIGRRIYETLRREHRAGK